MERYQVIDHTADIGIQADGETSEELFANSAWAFLDILTDADKVRAVQDRSFRVRAANREELLAAFLSELLYVFDVERLLFSEFVFSRLQERELDVTARGEPFNPAVHPVRHEIKAVTYHKLKIRKEGDLWRARVIFDI
jgi:SHS2 domain-containing protein